MGKFAFRWLRPTLYALALVGLCLSGYLMYLHALTMQGGAMPRVCGGGFDCTTVLQSSYAMVAGRVPVAALGVAYFMILSVWILFVGRLPGRLRHAWAVPALLTGMGVIDSIYLIHVMGWRLHAWCSFCLVTHVINLLLFAGVLTQWLKGSRLEEPGAEASDPRQLWKVPALSLLTGSSAALSLLLLLVVGAFSMSNQNKSRELAAIQQDADYLRWQFLRTRPEDLAVAADDPIRGLSNASHTVVMFGDFQCPGCAQTDKALCEVQKATGNAFRLVYKHYPQSSQCNTAVANSNKHAFACMAAEAAEAARLLGGNDAFWKMHDALYENQGRLAERPYTELARQIGLDPGKFELAMRDPAARRRVERDAALGKDLKLPGTPVLFLDGRRVSLDIITDVSSSETDVAKTTAHWELLLAAAETAAATQPATVTVSPDPAAAASQPIASRQ